MQYVWPYLSIWNTLHQSRYTVLWQRGQRSPRSGSSNLCSKETGDVTPSVEQRCEARLRSVRGSTPQVCTLNTVLLGRGNSVINWRVHREPPRPTGELTSPHLHSPQLWLSPWRARGSEKQEVILSAWSPISSLIACQPRVWLQAKLIKTKQPSLAASTTTSTYTQFRGCHTRAHAHTVRRNRM